jgi:hypothetical protein
MGNIHNPYSICPKVNSYSSVGVNRDLYIIHLIGNSNQDTTIQSYFDPCGRELYCTIYVFYLNTLQF